MRILLIGLLFCSSLSALNRLEYNEISLGMPVSQITRTYGDPYAVYDMGKGTVRFEYIERISMNNELVYENHYYLTIVEDKVVSKCFRELGRPPYDRIFRPDPNYPAYP